MEFVIFLVCCSNEEGKYHATFIWNASYYLFIYINSEE